MVALKLKVCKQSLSSDSYEEKELVTYAEAKNSTDLQPYIAAVFRSSGINESVFILGDGRYTTDQTSRTTNGYYNGPLEPGASYSIFQSVVVNEKVCIGHTDLKIDADAG